MLVGILGESMRQPWVDVHLSNRKWHLACLAAARQIKVARWQNLIPSFPCIVPGFKGVGAQSKESKGLNFAV